MRSVLRRRRLISTCWLEVLGAADGQPLVGALAGEAGLGGDDHAFGVGSEGFADEALGDFGAVGVGGVDEVDAEFDGASEDPCAVLRVFGLTPDALAGDAHGAKAERLTAGRRRGKGSLG